MNLGFILLNSFSLIISLIINIVFFGKERVHHVEDNTYGYLIFTIFITNLIGLFLGLSLGVTFKCIDILILILNKLYLILLII